MTDIVERLRGYHRDSAHGALHEAADEIERLRDIIEEHEHSSTVADIRAATIEECAKAVKPLDDCTNDILRSIRALKEHEAAAEIERLRKLEKINEDTIGPAMATFEQVRAATIEKCEVTICDVFASTSPRDYMMNGSGGILKRMIDALHALKERQT